MKDLIKKLEAKGIKVTNNRISKADVEKAVKILNKMTASTVANTPNKELQEKLESVVAEAEDLGIEDISDYFESSCTNGYDNGGSTGLRIFKNGMKFGILAQNSPVYQVDGENTSYFLFGDDNAKKTIGRISEDIKNNSEAQATSKIYKIDAYEMLVDHTTGGDANWFAEVIADSINENAGTLLCEAKGNDLVFNEISNIPSDKLFGEVVIKGDSWLIYTIDIENSVVSVEDGPDFEAKD